MQSTMMLMATVLLVAASGVSAESGANPVAQVISMLQGLKSKAVAAGQVEEQEYSKFAYWCKTSSSALNDAISEEEATLVSVKLDRKSLESDEASLTESIDATQKEIDAKMAAGADAKAVRADENNIFEKLNSDTNDAIQALNAARAAVKKSETTTEGLAQVKTVVRKAIALISMEATETEIKTLGDFGKPKSLADGDLNAHVDTYDFKSEGVLELLKKLKLDFEDKRSANLAAETNSLNTYDLTKLARDNAIEAATKAKKSDVADREQVKSDFADATKNQKDTQGDYDADTASRKSTTEMCAVKAREYDQRTKTRRDELSAMDSAVAILAEATGLRTKAPKNPMAPASVLSLLQVRQDKNPIKKAVALIRATGKEAHSKALERLAQEVDAHGNGPFAPMNSMVQKMIFRLMQEQKDEDVHKLWCDKEISKSDAMKADKEEKLEFIRADIKDETSKVMELTDAITTADEMINSITVFSKEAEEIRSAGKMENKLAIKDAISGQDAVAKAAAVLTSFYKATGAVQKEDWEFLQAPVKLPQDPALWASPAYASSTKDPSAVILAVLTQLGAKFATLKAETEAQEGVDQQEFETTMKANKIDKSRRTQETEMKKSEKKRRVGKISSLRSNEKNVQAQLDKTNQYLADIQKACVNGDSSYADRKAARTKEADGLRDAQKIVQDAFKAKPEAAKSLRFLEAAK